MRRVLVRCGQVAVRMRDGFMEKAYLMKFGFGHGVFPLVISSVYVFPARGTLPTPPKPHELSSLSTHRIPFFKVHLIISL